MAIRDTVAVLAGELGLAFQPLAAALRTPATFRDFLEELGWNFATPPAALDALRQPVVDLVTLVSGPPLEDSQLDDLLIDVLAAFAAVSDLGSASGLSEEFKRDFPRQLADYLLARYFIVQQPRWGFLLMALGVIRFEDAPATAERAAIERPVFAFEDLDDLLSDPLAFLKGSYHWGQSDFAGDRLAQSLVGLLEAWGFPVPERRRDLATLGALSAGSLAPDQVEDSSPELILIESDMDPDAFGAGVGLFLLPETATAKPGFALLPFATADFAEEVQITDNLTLGFKGTVDLSSNVGIFVRPDTDIQFLSGLTSGGPAPVTGDFSVVLGLGQPNAPIIILGSPDGSRLEIGGVSAVAGARFRNGLEVFTELALEAGKVVVKPAADDSDGFIASLLPGDGLNIDFNLMVGFSTTKGIYFGGSGRFEIELPVHRKIGPVEILSAALAIRPKSGGIPVDLAATIKGDFSILKATVQNIGLTANFTFPDDRKGNLGPVNLALGFKAPDGVGVVVDTGAVQGGGFLSIDTGAGRYSGAIELSVFGISVKAFGVIDTKFADGSKGFSFVIVIIAEFTPIQLSFGFTLLGIGGLLGINRSVNEKGLADAVRTGSLAHVLFPVDPVNDAPAIIHDLSTVFPATKDHFLIGPMAKLGWGTPTLIAADLGIIIEFPGPRIAVLGILRMLLPDPDDAVVQLQMAVAGLLDFPAQKFALDASLFDSTIAGYPVSGDMAFRLQLGPKAKFLLSVGGFNPGFEAPPPFPTLRRASVDFMVNGNPSLVASGYLAITSNTAQIGASIQLKASGSGIDLNGWLGFDVLFVFSPFSFNAGISAGVRISFHGHGIGITLRGSLTGPNPWHLKGRVCVSILWWDACLPIDVTFGNDQPATLPEIDPWVGDPAIPLIGLRDAMLDARNWSGTTAAGEQVVVSLAATATAQRTPIDPLGSATLRQKVAPLNRKLEKFGEYRPIVNDRFSLGRGVGTVSVDGVVVEDVEVVEDDFVPGHFMALSNEQKLSLPSYEPMDAGVAIASDRVVLGSQDSQSIAYVTKFIDDAGQAHQDAPHALTDAQLAGQLKRSPAALGGVRRTGSERYMLAGRPKKIQLDPRGFVVADACTLARNDAITGTEVSQTQALLALRAHLQANPFDQGRFTVVPVHALLAA